jgi:hypothetical protein
MNGVKVRAPAAGNLGGEPVRQAAESVDATARSTVEVKCSSKRISTADCRQIAIHWLLKYVESLQYERESWKNGLLINPRLNLLVEFSFQDLIELIALEKSYSSIIDTFCSVFSEETQVDHRDNEYELRSWPNV